MMFTAQTFYELCQLLFLSPALRFTNPCELHLERYPIIGASPTECSYSNCLSRIYHSSPDYGHGVHQLPLSRDDSRDLPLST